MRVKMCLSRVEHDLSHKGQELKDLRQSNSEWKVLWKRTLEIQKEMRLVFKALIQELIELLQGA